MDSGVKELNMYQEFASPAGCVMYGKTMILVIEDWMFRLQLSEKWEFQRWLGPFLFGPSCDTEVIYNGALQSCSKLVLFELAPSSPSKVCCISILFTVKETASSARNRDCWGRERLLKSTEVTLKGSCLLKNIISWPTTQFLRSKRRFFADARQHIDGLVMFVLGLSTSSIPPTMQFLRMKRCLLKTVTDFVGGKSCFVDFVVNDFGSGLLSLLFSLVVGWIWFIVVVSQGGFGRFMRPRNLMALFFVCLCCFGL